MLGCAGLGLGTGQLQTASEQRETVLPGYRLSDKTFLLELGCRRHVGSWLGQGEEEAGPGGGGQGERWIQKGTQHGVW